MKYPLHFLAMIGLVTLSGACSTEIEDPYAGTSPAQVARLELNCTGDGHDDTLTANGTSLLPCRVLLWPKYILYENHTINITSTNLRLSATNTADGATASLAITPTCDTVAFWVVAPRDYSAAKQLQVAIETVRLFGTVRVAPSLPDTILLVASTLEATVGSPIILTATLRNTKHFPRNVSGQLPISFVSNPTVDPDSVLVEPQYTLSEAKTDGSSTASTTITSRKAGVFTFKAQTQEKSSRGITITFKK